MPETKATDWERTAAELAIVTDVLSRLAPEQPEFGDALEIRGMLLVRLGELSVTDCPESALGAIGEAYRGGLRLEASLRAARLHQAHELGGEKSLERLLRNCGAAEKRTHRPSWRG